MMDSEVICNPKKISDSLTDSLNNIGSRDASASKNIMPTMHISDVFSNDKKDTGKFHKFSIAKYVDI